MIKAVQSDHGTFLVHAPSQYDSTSTNVPSKSSEQKQERITLKPVTANVQRKTDVSFWASMRKRQQQSKILLPILGYITRRIYKYSKTFEFEHFSKKNPKGCIIFSVLKHTKAQLILEPTFVPLFEATGSSSF